MTQTNKYLQEHYGNLMEIAETSRQNLCEANADTANPPLPKQKGIKQDQWDSWVTENYPALLDVFKKAKVEIVAFNPDDAFYGYFMLKRGSMKFRLGLNQVDAPHKVKMLSVGLKNVVDALPTALKDFEGRDDVWYSDMDSYVKRIFKTNNENRNLLYGFLADVLKSKNISVHS